MLHHAYLIKGWLLDKDPPKAVSEALEAIIAGVAETVAHVARIQRIDSEIEVLTAKTEALTPQHPKENLPVSEPQEAPKQTNPTPPLQRKGWTPERKAAQAEIMRKAREAKAAKKMADEANAQPEPVPTFTEAELRITVPKARRKSQLTDADWPEIKEMLAAGRSRATIASDYDEELEDLDFFIASCKRREANSPGEAGASPSGVASGAARQTW